jgi:cytidine deaminase
MNSVSENSYQEVILGLVAPIGVDLDKIVDHLCQVVKKFNFEPVVIQVNQLQNILELEELTTIDRTELDSRSIEMGKLRKNNADTGIESEVFTSLFIKYLSCSRSSDNKVYILDSLKRPEEIERLKTIYGKSFYTVGVTSTYEDRIKQKTKELGDSEVAKKQVDEDYEKQINSKDPFNNQTNKAFQLSDLFLNLSDENLTLVYSHLERFVDLIFGAPIVTPTPNEHNMFLAYMSSLRSADLSRQVGSAITNQHHDIIAMGANDVPQYGGGHYWPDTPYIVYDTGNKNNHLFEDQRDYTLGVDKNSEEKDNIIYDIITSLKTAVTDVSTDKLYELINKTKLADITEYGRAVHAEMSALMTAARNGVKVNKATMYCTTYPCHNCAKHIVAAGLDKVFYIEPYPKSKAIELHKDSITDTEFSDNHKVKFEAFSGIGPKRYQDLFSMKLGDGQPIIRKIGSESIPFNRNSVKSLRVPVNIKVTKLNEDDYLTSSPEVSYISEKLVDENRKTSEIKFFLKSEKYGCIKALSDYENDLFFRIVNLDDTADIELIKRNAKVSFEIVKGDKKGVLFADKIQFT